MFVIKYVSNDHNLCIGVFGNIVHTKNNMNILINVLSTNKNIHVSIII